MSVSDLQNSIYSTCNIQDDRTVFYFLVSSNALIKPAPIFIVMGDKTGIQKFSTCLMVVNVTCIKPGTLKQKTGLSKTWSTKTENRAI